MKQIQCHRRPAGLRGRTLLSARRQAGLTLIEFMVSIVIGMLMIAALAVLIASQSATRGDIDKTGRMIENGRYAAQTMVNDIRMGGYWGELGNQPAVPPAWPDSCSTTATDIALAMGLHVQGLNAPATLPAALAVCVKNQKPGTDVLVVRRADPDMSALQTPVGDVDLTKLTAGRTYIQTGMDSTGATLTSVLAAASSDSGTNASTFILKKKDMVKLANIRPVEVHIYYIAKCSVELSGSCTGADGGNPIPTLKRVDLGAAGGLPVMTTLTIAEGIENLQLDYGVDTDADGSPNGSDVDGSALSLADWSNVMTLKIYLLARSSEVSQGFSDTKQYVMGTAGTITPATAEQGYKRHLFVQSVRVVNPSSKRAL